MGPIVCVDCDGRGCASRCVVHDVPFQPQCNACQDGCAQGTIPWPLWWQAAHRQAQQGARR